VIRQLAMKQTIKYKISIIHTILLELI